MGFAMNNLNIENSKIKTCAIYSVFLIAGLFTGKVIFTFLPKPAPLAVESVAQVPAISLPEVKSEVNLAPKAASVAASAVEAAAKAIVVNIPKIEPLPELTITGILFSPEPGGSFALVNGKVIRQGDNIQGAVVTNIGEDWVELKLGERVFKAYLKKSF